MSQYKSGFVAVIGRPNVGKSTMLNALLGQKIAIVSNKPQTTRNTIQAVLTKDQGQIVFLDTPGVHRPVHKLGEYMLKAARTALKEVDTVCMLVDVSKWRKADDHILTELAHVDTPVILIANKIDLISQQEQEDFCQAAAEKYNFAQIIPVSAREENNLDFLVQSLFQFLPVGPQYYPDDWITDHPERFVIAEFIREQILQNTEDEIPHSVAVYIDEIKENKKKGLVCIRATIYVERDSQKGIVIGKQGAMLKKIGSEARQQIETLLGSRVYLDMWVKVKKDWRDKPGSLHELGYQ